MNAAIGKLQRTIARARQARFYREQIRPGLLATALGVGLLFAATDAHALGPLNVEVAGKLGVGSNPGLGIDPMGFGVGARGGVSILGLYGGVNVMYYFGTNESVSPPPGGPTSEFIHTLLYGVEGGTAFASTASS